MAIDFLAKTKTMLHSIPEERVDEFDRLLADAHRDAGTAVVSISMFLDFLKEIWPDVPRAFVQITAGRKVEPIAGFKDIHPRKS